MKSSSASSEAKRVGCTVDSAFTILTITDYSSVIEGNFLPRRSMDLPISSPDTCSLKIFLSLEDFT